MYDPTASRTENLTLSYRPLSGKGTGLEVLEKAGSLIGWSNGEPVRTPYDHCILIMPSLAQLRRGVTVVRLGRIERRYASTSKTA